MIEGFAGAYLSHRYDEPQPTPAFHRTAWALYVSSVDSAGCAAPRNHAKSTGLTHAFICANVAFKVEDYIILVGATEEQAIEHLGDIANEFRENEDLIRDFKIKGFIQDQKTDIIVERLDGSQFRILARGAEQKIRGRKWRNKRPGLIVCDDLEDDEQVENKDRRKKFRKWFFRALKPALKDGGRVRIHGTILHVDSLLMHLSKNKSWKFLVFRAHRGINDFSEILWPEKFSEKRLRKIKSEFAAEGDLAGYSQEYLNNPMDNEDAYLKKDWFLPMTQEDHDAFKIYGVGVDFAVSKQDHANRTAFVVGGKDIRNLLHHVDVRVGRMDTSEIVEEFFSIQARWNPDYFFVEDGVIWLALYPSLRNEMSERDVWLNVVPMKSIKDKAVRGRPMQKRMKNGGARYDKETEWYPDFEDELLVFTGVSDALFDDQFDGASILSRGMEDVTVEADDSLSESEAEFENQRRREDRRGRSEVTGY